MVILIRLQVSVWHRKVKQRHLYFITYRTWRRRGQRENECLQGGEGASWTNEAGHVRAIDDEDRSRRGGKLDICTRCCDTFVFSSSYYSYSFCLNLELNCCI